MAHATSKSLLESAQPHSPSCDDPRRQSRRPAPGRWCGAGQAALRGVLVRKSPSGPSLTPGRRRDGSRAGTPQPQRPCRGLECTAGMGRRLGCALAGTAKTAPSRIILDVEVVIDQGDVDASAGRHRAHRRRLKPEIGEQRPRRQHHVRTGVAATNGWTPCPPGHALERLRAGSLRRRTDHAWANEIADAVRMTRAINRIDLTGGIRFLHNRRVEDMLVRRRRWCSRLGRTWRKTRPRAPDSCGAVPV